MGQRRTIGARPRLPWLPIRTGPKGGRHPSSVRLGGRVSAPLGPRVWGVEVGAVASGPVSDAAIAALASAVFLATGVLVYIRGRRTGLVGTRGFGLYLFAAGAGVGFLALVLLLQES